MTLYVEGTDDAKEEEDTKLPELEVGEKLKEEKLEPKQSFTEPPPRYTEASLVKALEEKGIRKTKYLFTYNYYYFRKKIYRKRAKAINTNRFRKNCK